MIKIGTLMIVSVILAYYSEKYTNEVKRCGQFYSVLNDRAYLALAVVLVLFSGLRRDYNDTWNYLNAFRNNKGLADFLSDSQNLNLMENPLFHFFRSFLKELTGNDQYVIFIPSAFTQICFLRFFKRYSENFTFSVFLYITLGTFAFTMGALKQAWAMGIVTLAFPHMEKRQWVRYYLIIFIAMLIHTYAMAYAVLPLFRQRPWKLFTYLFVMVLVMVMMNFEGAISAFMDQAEEFGKELSEETVFHNHGVNILRVAVYAVTPLISFYFQKWIFPNTSDMDHVLVHMSIISFAFMLMGTQSGANMFARMAQYFELGTICCLPRMLKKPFEERSYKLISTVAIGCFLVYFAYAFGIDSHFDNAYKANSILGLFGL